MDQKLAELAKVYEQLTHRDIAGLDENFLLQSVLSRLNKVSILDWDEYNEILKSDTNELNALSQELTITTSFFLRDSLTFAALESVILDLWEQKKGKNDTIRIWCAGCAAGQEPFSVAIAIHDIQEKCGIKIPYRIFATDISESALETARAAVYDERTLQNVTLRQLNRYFIRDEKRYQLINEIKSQVSFSKQDLLSRDGIVPVESIYGHFDVILCCNLLIYYKPSVQNTIVDMMFNALSGRGVLILGESEHGLLENHPRFRPLTPKTGIFKTKERAL